jgi:hypothetical protein
MECAYVPHHAHARTCQHAWNVRMYLIMRMHVTLSAQALCDSSLRVRFLMSVM